jgi:DNA-binding NtrC family response regulator
VVIITALVSAVPTGAKALLTKPINVNKLMSLVERYCVSGSS